MKRLIVFLLASLATHQVLIIESQAPITQNFAGIRPGKLVFRDLKKWELELMTLYVTEETDSDAVLLSELCWKESAKGGLARYTAKSKKNAVGLCQIQPVTWKDYKCEGLMEEGWANIRCADKILNKRIKICKSIVRGLDSYNSGTSYCPVLKTSSPYPYDILHKVRQRRMEFARRKPFPLSLIRRGKRMRAN